MIRLHWRVLPGQVSITEYRVQRSKDGGRSYESLEPLAHTPGGANQRVTGLVTYEDAGGSPGDIYRVTAVGELGESEPLVIVAPPAEPKLCMVIGYVLDVFGNADRSAMVHVTGGGDRVGEAWARNQEGIVASNPEAVGLTSGSAVVTPDSYGMWQVKLVRRSYARVRIPSMGLDWSFEVPDSPGPVNIRDIPLRRGADHHGIFPDQSNSPGHVPFA